MKVLHSVPENLWNEVARRCESAMFFHTFAWADAIQKSFPTMRNAAMAFQFGHDDWVIFPMIQVGTELRGFFKHYASSEPGVYGGPISNNPLTAERVERMLPHLQNLRTAGIKVFGNPLLDLDPFLKTFNKIESSTHILALTDHKDKQSIYAGYSRDVKKGIRDAEAQRTECALIEDPAGIKDYYAVYEEVTRLRGANATNNYPLHLFQNLFERKQDGVKFWAARLYGKVIGGVVSCEFNKHIDLWHAAWLPVAHNIGAGKFVYNKVIEYAFERGFRHFDFNPSGGHRGTMKLKEEFGCFRKDFHDYCFEGRGIWARYAQWRPRIKKAEAQESSR